MGAGASTPASVEAALADGFTREQIDAYLRQHPEARREASDLQRVARGGLARGRVYPNRLRTDEQREARLKEEYVQRLTQARQMFDACDGDLDALAERLPGTGADKMRDYVAGKIRQYQEHAASRTSEDGDDGDRFQEYRQPNCIWARAHVDGVFYD
jgi:hypothetical protein